MTNFEKYKERITRICNADHVSSCGLAVTKNGYPTECETLDCGDCICGDLDDDTSCQTRLLEWAAAEYQKPKEFLVTKDEIDFLNYVKGGYLYRHDTDELIWLSMQPEMIKASEVAGEPAEPVVMLLTPDEIPPWCEINFDFIHKNEWCAVKDILEGIKKNER